MHIANDGTLRYSDHMLGEGETVIQQACKGSMEGIVSKRVDSVYAQAARSPAWLKVKCAQAQEVVIGGYTDPEGARTGLGALLIGVYERGHLRYAGKVGTGFTTATLRALRRRLGPLAQRESPFADRVPGVRRVHWVRPELVAEVAFTEWTGDGKLRHPSFKGLREDKKPTEVVRERPIPTAGGDGPKT